MSRTIEALVGGMAPLTGTAVALQPKRLIAAWQNGYESGGHVQHKLRLGFADALTQRPAN